MFVIWWFWWWVFPTRSCWWHRRWLKWATRTTRSWSSTEEGVPYEHCYCSLEAKKLKNLLFHSRDLNINSPYSMPYFTYNLALKIRQWTISPSWYFLSSYHPSAWQCIYIGRRNNSLFTPGSERVKERKLSVTGVWICIGLWFSNSYIYRAHRQIPWVCKSHISP